MHSFSIYMQKEKKERTNRLDNYQATMTCD